MWHLMDVSLDFISMSHEVIVYGLGFGLLGKLQSHQHSLDKFVND